MAHALDALPSDIYDHLFHFLSNKSLFSLLLASKKITVSTHLLQQRKWSAMPMEIGDLQAVQYLNRLGQTQTIFESLLVACQYGHLSIVTFLYSLEPVCHIDNLLASCLAYEKGHLDIVKFFHTNRFRLYVPAG